MKNKPYAFQVKSRRTGMSNARLSGCTPRLHPAAWLLLPAILPMQVLMAAEGVGSLQPLPERLPQPAKAQVLPAPEVEPTVETGSSQQNQVFIKQITLQGNTVFTADELAVITDKYQNRLVSADEIQQLRQELTVFYVKQGYINSGAVLPEQNINNGELNVQIIEGRLTGISLLGLEHLQESYLKSRIEKDTRDEALNIKTLQNDLQLIQQNPLIKRINAELMPGSRPGEALLRAVVEEALPWYLTLGANNLGVPAVGAERFETWAGHRDVFGYGDAFDGHFNVSAGQTQYDFNYSIPFTSWDTRFKFRYQKSEANIVEKPFDQININNNMEGFGLGLTQPIWHTLQDEVTLGLLLEHRRSQLFIGSRPVSFGRGSVNGVSDVSVIRFSQDWLRRTATDVLALRSTASVGVDALGSTIHPNSTLPDSNFFVWLGQAQWIKVLTDDGIELRLRGDTQISASPLLSLEQFTLGGRYSVRGYRQNELVRDSGFSSSIEFHIPLMPDKAFKLAPFFDTGRAWFQDFATNAPHVLSSTGLGLLFDPNKQVHAELYWAHPFTKIKTPSHDLQDDGINFAVTYSPLN